MEVKITLSEEQITKLIVADIEWHAEHCECKQYKKSLKTVLEYYTGSKS